jgi:hypothetical protein
MEKAVAFPLLAGFMPNSPLPMLDVCDWLLLMTVSTTGGGRMDPILLCGVSLYYYLLVAFCHTGFVCQQGSLSFFFCCSWLLVLSIR